MDDAGQPPARYRSRLCFLLGANDINGGVDHLFAALCTALNGSLVAASRLGERRQVVIFARAGFTVHRLRVKFDIDGSSPCSLLRALGWRSP